MYSRTYSDDKSGIIIPDSYGGTALFEAPREENEEPKGKNPWEESDAKEASLSVEGGETIGASSFLSKLGIANFLPNIFKNNNFGLQKIGKEEILILATAAFLFFSKEGDRECALMLLLLLFLT